MMPLEKTIHEITESVKALFDLTSRVDERINWVISSNKDLRNMIDQIDSKIQYNSEKSAVVSEKLSLNEHRIVDMRSEIQYIKSDMDDTDASMAKIEKRVSVVEQHSDQTANIWKTAIGYVVQGSFTIILCYLLYKLNLQTPPLP